MIKSDKHHRPVKYSKQVGMETIGEKEESDHERF
jgi:hypothetical protein